MDNESIDSDRICDVEEDLEDYPDAGRSKLLRNVGQYLPDYRVQHLYACSDENLNSHCIASCPRAGPFAHTITGGHLGLCVHMS